MKNKAANAGVLKALKIGIINVNLLAESEIKKSHLNSYLAPDISCTILLLFIINIAKCMIS